MYGAAEPCGPSCRPGCDRHGWLELIPGGGDQQWLPSERWRWTPADPRQLRIEVKPVLLHEAIENEQAPP
jgi:hypothetical protein